MSSLRAVLVFRDVRPGSGGLAIDIRDVAGGLARRGHRVTVVTMAADADGNGCLSQGLDGVPVVSLPPLPPQRMGWKLGLTRGVGGLTKSGEPAVLHVYSCLPVYMHFASMAAARRQGHPIVWTPMMHPARARSWAHYGAAGAAMRAFDLVAPRVARFVDAVAAATEAEAEAFARLGAPRVELLPPGVHERRPVHNAQALALRDRLGLGDDPVVMVVAARADRRKGLEFGMRAFRSLREDLPQSRLLLVGSGSSDLADERQHVHAAGRLPDDQLPVAYRAADVVLVPSSYEAFSRVVIEAWQQERPVVVTDGVALSGSVQRGGGLVVPFGDVQATANALRAMLEDRQPRREDGRLGRRKVDQHYLVSRIVERTEALYEELLGV